MSVSSLPTALVVGALLVALSACVALWRTRRQLRAAHTSAERLDADLARVRGTAATKERLLAAVIEAAPMAIVLFGDRGDIVFTNQEARELFFEGRSPEGEDFLALLATAPDPLRRAVLADRDELVTVEEGERAEEAGGDTAEVELEVESLESDGGRLTVRDRGRGMSDEVMRHALLPFYSTKESGSGLGLALCREIVEAHGGRVRLRNREGAEVGIRLPARGIGEAPAVKLTLSRS